MFVWVDLRGHIGSLRSSDNVEISTLRITNPDVHIYKKREADFDAVCKRNGMSTACGSNFLAEEIGWFRLTFTVSPDALIEAIQRLVNSLAEVQQQGWKEE